MKLEITKEKVLEAALKCSAAKSTLETLFPECFEKALPKFPSGIYIPINGSNGIENRRESADDYAKNVIWLDGRFNWKVINASGGGYLLVVNYK